MKNRIYTGTRDGINKREQNIFRMERELLVAKDMQLSLRPKLFEKDEFVDLYGVLIPAMEVGGDFYDYFKIDEQHICFVIGDVSGKGAASAIMMAVCKSLIKGHAQYNLSPSKIINTVNEEIASSNPMYMFVSVILAILNVETGELKYTNAGHNHPFLITENQEVTLLENFHGPVIGAMEDFIYPESSLFLEKGSSFFIYTDGITEAQDCSNQLYGTNRLKCFLAETPCTTPKALVHALVTSILLFERGREQADDVTALCLHRLPCSA